MEILKKTMWLLFGLTCGFISAGKEVCDSELEEEEIEKVGSNPVNEAIIVIGHPANYKEVFKGIVKTYKDKKTYIAPGPGVYYGANITDPEAIFKSGPAVMGHLLLKCGKAEIEGTVVEDFQANYVNTMNTEGFKFKIGSVKGDNATAVFKKSAWISLTFEGKNLLAMT
jgi:hypothetical protein